MQFTPDNSRLKFCRIGVPVYSWCADYSSEMERIGLYPTSKAVVLHGHRRDSVIVDMPFYQDHVRNFLPPTTTFPRRCVTKFLAIAITELGEDQQVFVILMTLETAADACHHQPMLYWNPRHEPVELIAKLDGFRRGSSSLGTVMAISPKGSRIALSDWSELRVWALNPGALHEDPLELYWPAQDICQECELVVIRPVQLPPRGVIHSMCWRDENELYAMTDQGLVRWDVGCRAYGKRESLSFELAT